MPTLAVTFPPAAHTLVVTTPEEVVAFEVPQTITGITTVQAAPDVGGVKGEGKALVYDPPSGLLVYTPVARLAPTAAVPNVVVPATAAVVPLALRAQAGQTADLQQWQTSAGATLLNVDKDGRLNAGFGDAQHLFQSTDVAGQFVEIRRGTAGAPDTAGAPLVKLTRTLALGKATQGNPAELEACLTAISVGVPGNAVQTTAIAAIAIQGSVGVPIAVTSIVGNGATVTVTVAADHGAVVNDYAYLDAATAPFAGTWLIASVPTSRSFTFASSTVGAVAAGTAAIRDVRTDAAAVYAYSQSAINSLIGLEGMYVAVNRPTGHDLVGMHCVEFQVQNLTVEEDYNQTTVPNSRVMTMRAIHNGIGAGIVFARVDDATMDVGLGAPLFPGNGDSTGPFRQAMLRDDTKAPYSLRIEGQHSVASIAAEQGSGPVLFGDNTPTGGEVTSVFSVRDNVGSTSVPMIRYGSFTSVKPHCIDFATVGATLRQFVAGTAGDFFSGTAQGDFGFKLVGAGLWLWLGGQTGGRTLGVSEDGQILLGRSTSAKIGLWGKTPAVQPSGRLTAQNYVSAPRTLNRNAYTLANVVDFILEMFTLMQTTGWHA